jgi:uncharacterized protein
MIVSRVAVGIVAIVGALALWHAPHAAGQDAPERARQAAQDAAAQASHAVRGASAEAAHAFRADPWFWGNAIAAAAVLLFLFGRDVIRPGSLTRGGQRGVRELGPLIWLACGGLIFLTQQVAAGAALAALGTSPAGAGPRDLAILSASGLLAGLAAALVLVRLLNASARSAGLGFKGSDIPLGLICGVAALPVAQSAGFLAIWINSFLTTTPHKQVAHETLQRLIDSPGDPWLWVIGALAVIVAPIVEEVIYRGCLQSALLALTGRPWISIILTSAVFTAAHLGVGPWYALASIFALSLGLGVAMERCKSIAVPITMHVLFNAANVALALWVRPA